MSESNIGFALLTVLTVWYGRTRNRGYLSPEYLEKLEDVPFVEERWKQLAVELSAWRKQTFDMRKVKRV